MAVPAFTSVSARRTFTQPPPYHAQPPPPPPQPTSQKIEWPPSVRDYVQRTFALDQPVATVTKDEMTEKLKSIINDAANRGTLYSDDWYNKPLPHELILQERARINFHAPVADSTPLLHHTYPASRIYPVPTDPSPNPKKRKSTDYDDDAINGPNAKKALVPNNNPLEDRLTFPQVLTKQQQKKKKKQEQAEAFQPQDMAVGDLQRRLQRFGAASLADISAKPMPKEDVMPQGPVIGTSDQLEKRYFRLTAPPKPETVRPLHVLRKTLAMLKEDWKSRHNYNYICDQFKSLRQDLTVQRIRNEFTVEAYEVHARIALDKGDLGEYNQCQTQLRALYKQNLGGNPGEFLAYRILYFIYTSNRPDMNTLLASLTPSDRKDAAVQHALRLRSALALGNYHRFFRLYAIAPNMGGNLIEMFLNRERLGALAKLCKSYKQTVPLSFVTEELAFDEDAECAEFLCAHNGENFFDKRDDGIVHFATAKAMQTFENARATAFRGVDIKGQI